MSQDPFEHIAEILRNHEVRPSGNATFEEVMNRRKKKRRGFFWWFQRTGIGLLLLGIAGGIAYFNSSNLNTSVSHTATPTVKLNTTTKGYRLEAASPEKEINQNQKTESLDVSPSASNAAGKSTGKGTSKVEIKSSEKAGLFGLFQKFNKQRKNILGLHTVGDKPESTANSNRELRSLGLSNGTQTEGISPEGSSVYKNGGSPMSLSNVYDFGAKQYIAQTYFDFNIPPSGDEYVDWNFDLPSAGLRKRRLPWYVEFSAITGSDNQVQFDPNENLSVLGTNYMAQYQLSLLREFKGADMWGLGLHYTQWVGNGEWRKRDFIDVWQYDTTTVAINIPGLPTQFITRLDSQMISEYSVRTGLIKYNIDKISVPISFRGFTRFLKTDFRYAAQMSPGITRITKGSYFTPTDFMPIDRTQRFSFGAKVGMGPIIPVGNGVSIVIEPSLMYESFLHTDKGLQGNIFGGLGISMMWRLK